MPRKDSVRGIQLINSGPHLVEELPDLFAKADPRAVASGWIAVLLDTLGTFHEVPTGSLARALLEVAKAIGLEVPNGPVTVQLDGAAWRLHNEKELEMAEAVIGELGFAVVKDAAPPPPKKGQRVRSPLVQAMLKFQPGDHILVDLRKLGIGKSTINQHATKVRKERTLTPKDYYVYEPVGPEGRMVIVYETKDQPAQSAPLARRAG